MFQESLMTLFLHSGLVMYLGRTWPRWSDGGVECPVQICPVRGLAISNCEQFTMSTMLRWTALHQVLHKADILYTDSFVSSPENRSFICHILNRQIWLVYWEWKFRWHILNSFVLNPKNAVLLVNPLNWQFCWQFCWSWTQMNSLHMSVKKLWRVLNGECCTWTCCSRRISLRHIIHWKEPTNTHIAYQRNTGSCISVEMESMFVFASLASQAARYYWICGIAIPWGNLCSIT